MSDDQTTNTADDQVSPSGPKTVTTSDGTTLTVKVDRDLCIGAATCVAVTPKMFALDGEAKAILLDTASEESYQSVMDSAKSCPVAAIILTDQDGNQVYPA